MTTKANVRLQKVDSKAPSILNKNILDSSSFTFDDETTNKIVEKMVEEKLDKRKVRDYIEMSEDGDQKRCYEFMIQLQERYLLKLDESVRARLKVYIGTDDYGSAIDLLEEYFKKQRNGKSKLIDEIIDHDFYFPDLSDDITSASLDYCHKIVEIMTKLKIGCIRKDGKNRPVNGPTIGHIVDMRYVPLKKLETAAPGLRDYASVGLL